MLKANSVFNNMYTVQSEIGSGHSADVYRIECNQTKKLYALKVIKNKFLESDPNGMKQIHDEIEIQKKLDHKNMVKLHDSGFNGYTNLGQSRLVYMIMEYLPNHEMFDFVKTCGKMGEDTGRFFLKQFVDALQYMHEEQGVVHIDLKLENILIQEDFTIKIADFGFATRKNINKLNLYRGTKTYMAPEIKRGEYYKGKEVDIFSIGVIVFILVVGLFPF